MAATMVTDFYHQLFNLNASTVSLKLSNLNLLTVSLVFCKRMTDMKRGTLMQWQAQALQR